MRPVKFAGWYRYRRVTHRVSVDVPDAIPLRKLSTPLLKVPGQIYGFLLKWQCPQGENSPVESA